MLDNYIAIQHCQSKLKRSPGHLLFVAEFFLTLHNTSVFRWTMKLIKYL